MVAGKQPAPAGTKVCSRKDCAHAGRAQPFPAAFNKHAVSPTGYRYHCRDCDNLLNARSRERNRARNAARQASPEPAEFEITVEAPPEAPAEAVVAPPPPPPPQPVDPLQSAYEANQEARAKRDLKREHSALFGETERLRRELDAVRAAQRPAEILVYRQPAWERSDAISCAIASDWHVEEAVEKESVHGLNEYNLEIAKSRAEHFFKNWLRLTDIMAKDAKINTMFLAGLGDFFSGWIHEELMANTLLAPADAARFCKGLFISGIDYLLRESSYTLEGLFIPGNHGRMTDKMHLGDPTGTSLETVMYDGIVDRFHGNPRVRIEVSEHAVRYRTFFESFVVRLLHGYEVKYGGGVGGLTIPLNKAIAQWDIAKKAESTWLGHFHQKFFGPRFVVNGSMIGYNAFAQAIRAGYEPPAQAFFTINARRGGEMGVQASIWLDDAS